MTKRKLITKSAKTKQVKSVRENESQEDREKRLLSQRIRQANYRESTARTSTAGTSSASTSIASTSIASTSIASTSTAMASTAMASTAMTSTASTSVQMQNSKKWQSEQREARLGYMRDRAGNLRKNETSPERLARLSKLRSNAIERRTVEPDITRQTRLEKAKKQKIENRGAETVEERAQRLLRKREENIIRRTVQWGNKRRTAFRYNAAVDYVQDPDISIGEMQVICNYCQAQKFPSESAGFCCNNGKVRLTPIEEPVEPLKSLLWGRHENSRHFLGNSRKYNSAFQMTSFGANEVREGNFMPTFKVQGQVYHLAGSLLPETLDAHKFLQIYFITDYVEQARVRQETIPGLNSDLTESLQQMLHDNNGYVISFKTALEQMPARSDSFKVVICADRKPQNEHRGRFNAPSTNEVGIVIVGQQFEKRDIILHGRNNKLQRISETHRSYDALQYPLMFPRGEDGYYISILQVDPVSGEFNDRRTVSAMNFYAYRMMVRHQYHNHLHYYRQLVNQYWVDMYAKIESERLCYIRLNQRRLRAESYIHLQDAVNGDENANNIGQMVILPSSFTGSPRYMHEKTQDAMTYVRNYGRPDLFITFTCNPKWSEISRNLFEEQKSHDRHDIVSRVFRLKVKSLMSLLTKGELFGTVACHMYSIEWQKRGLPHAHILLWMHTKIRPNEIDLCISAEIPNEEEDPLLFEIVRKNMIHGPCGHLNRGSPCMESGKCSKRFPREFVKETQTGDDGYPKYRRRSPRDGGFTTSVTTRSGHVEVDNRWVVPYCPVLSRSFDAHINVEYCNSVKAIKYICKYINKGSDQATFALENENDEVTKYQTGRYISTSEAVWRILSFPVHERSPTVVHLAVHLENGQRVYFTASNIRQKLENTPKTTLTAFFELCSSDNYARTLLYNEVPKYYTWNGKQFNRRKQGIPLEGVPGVFQGRALGRVYAVHPNNSECFYLRMLLHSVRGPTSFQYLKTVEGNECETFQSACNALGLLESDRHWEETLQDAVVSESPSRLRELFAIMLVFCHLAEPIALWNNFRESLSEDVLRQVRHKCPGVDVQFSDDIYNQALIYLEDKLRTLGDKRLIDFGMPTPHRDRTNILNEEYLRETNYNVDEIQIFLDDNEPKLVDDQQQIYTKILESVENSLGKLYFIDAPGGTGKTFVINMLLAKVRALGKIALGVASSGIAATLLQGGRTAHSMFKLPLNLTYAELPVCSIKKNSPLAKVLQDCALIVWDECTMANRGAVEALDRTLQDIRGNDTCMGGVTFAFAGDFRQTLPIIPRGTRADEINACLKSSPIWNRVDSLSLSTNMRVHLNGDRGAGDFANKLLQIGNGTVPVVEGVIVISETIGSQVETLEQLISKVYPDVVTLAHKPIKWLQERAILAPKNEVASEINIKILQQFDAEEMVYHSVDTITHVEELVHYPVEFLNSLNPPGLPQHKLLIKVGAPVMLLRNLCPPKLCNGTRLQVVALKKNLVEARILTGSAVGESVFIPRIPLIPTDMPFEFKRLQFPLKVCFAMTINKAQGQSFNVAGVDLRCSCFAHGQLYVALSRVGQSKDLYILAQNGKTPNVVYREAL